MTGPAPRRRLAAALAGSLLPATSGLTGQASAAGADRTTFTVGMTQDVDSLNPFTGIVSSAYEMYQLNYNTLTDYGQADFAAEPSLAESWDVSDDGLTWTYTIRSNVTWSDGEPLTARDVAYTFNRVMKGKYEQTNFGSYVGQLTSVEATDDQTVVMKVKAPSPTMLHLFVYILPEHVWKDIDAKEVTDYTKEPGPDGIVGSGPFIVKEHKKGQFIRLERNESYWGGKPKFDELVFRIFTNEDSLAQALRRGEIDFADDLGSNVFESLDGAEGVTTFPATYSGFDEIAFNVGAALEDGTPVGDGHPALKDQRVRVALSLAIDTQALVERVLGGHGTPGTSVIPPIYEDLHYDPGASTYAFDPAAAERLLDEVGYAKGSDGIRTMPEGGPAAGRKLSFRLLDRASSQTSQQSVQFVAGWLEDIGIEVKTKIVSEDALTEIIGDGTFDMFEWGWVVEPDPDYQLSTFTCANRSYKDGGSVYANLSDSFFCDEGYDALYAKQKQQIDPAERAATVREMQKRLYEQAPYVVTFYYDKLEAYRSDRFTDFLPQPEPDGSLLFQYGTPQLPLTPTCHGRGQRLGRGRRQGQQGGRRRRGQQRAGDRRRRRRWAGRRRARPPAAAPAPPGAGCRVAARGVGATGSRFAVCRAVTGLLTEESVVGGGMAGGHGSHQDGSGRYDVVVVGGGHNGLVAAAYLARAGLRTVVCESRPVVGGAAVTETPFGPDYKVTSLSYVVSLLPPSLVRDLSLDRYGYHVYPQGPYFAPHTDGRYLALPDDRVARREQIAKFSDKDAAAIDRWDAWLDDLAALLAPLLSAIPPRIGSRRPADVAAQLGLLRMVRGIDTRRAVEVTRLFTMSIADLLDDYFESDAMKALLSVSGVIGTWAGPRSAGTAYVMAHHHIGDIGDGDSNGDGGAPTGKWGFPRGGMGAVTQAMAAAARSFGVEIRTSAPVQEISTRGGAVTGVVLESGEELSATTVVTTAHPAISFLKLVDRSALPPDFLADIERWKSRSGVVKVNLAVERLPEFTSRPGFDPDVHGGTIVLAESLDDLEGGFQDAVGGRASVRPFADIAIPSVFDDSLAPPGHHVVSMFTQWVPHEWSQTPHVAEMEAHADAVVARVEEVAPGFTSSVLHRQVIGPHAMETEYGLVGGNIFHGELSASQLFHARPAAGYADLRTPVRGLYQAGSGTHGGGGVTGIPGRNAVKQVLSDLRRERLRSRFGRRRT